MALLVMMSSLGGLTGIVLTAPRVYYTMAGDGLAFRWLDYVHPVYRTPSRAIVAQAVWASVLAATGAYRELFTRVIYTEWLFFALMAYGAVRAQAAARLPTGVSHVGLSRRACGLHPRVVSHRHQPDRAHAVRSTDRTRDRGVGRAGLLSGGREQDRDLRTADGSITMSTMRRRTRRTSSGLQFSPGRSHRFRRIN